MPRRCGGHRSRSEEHPRRTRGATGQPTAVGGRVTRRAAWHGDSQGGPRRQGRSRAPAPAHGASRELCWLVRTPRVPYQVAPRRRNDADKPAEERDRLEHQVGAAVGPRPLELVRDAAVSGPGQPVVRERGPSAPSRLPRGTSNAGVRTAGSGTSRHEPRSWSTGSVASSSPNKRSRSHERYSTRERPIPRSPTRSPMPTGTCTATRSKTATARTRERRSIACAPCPGQHGDGAGVLGASCARAGHGRAVHRRSRGACGW